MEGLIYIFGLLIGLVMFIVFMLTLLVVTDSSFRQSADYNTSTGSGDSGDSLPNLS